MTDMTEQQTAQTDGCQFNCGTPYGAAREYSRIPAVIGYKGGLTNHHWTVAGAADPGVKVGDCLLGDRVSAADASHFLIHSLTVIPASSLASVSSASADGRVVATAKRLSAMMGCEFVPHATGADDAHVASPEPVPATNQAGEVDEAGIANKAVMANLNEDGTCKYQSAQGYACAREAVRLTLSALGIPPAKSRNPSSIRSRSNLEAAMCYAEGQRETLATQPATSQEVRDRAIAIIAVEAEEMGYCAEDVQAYRDGEFDGDDQLTLQSVERALAATPTPPTLSEDLREALELLRRREVQMMGAAISTRNWHDMETAYNAGRDRLDAVLIEIRRAALAQVKAS